MKKDNKTRFMRGVFADTLDEIFDRERISVGMLYDDDTPEAYHTRMLCYALKAKTTTELLFRVVDLMRANLTLARHDGPRLPTWALQYKAKLCGLLVHGKYDKGYFRTGSPPTNKAWACHTIQMAVVDWAEQMVSELRAKGRCRQSVMADRLEREVRKCLNFWAEKPMPMNLHNKEKDNDTSITIPAGEPHALQEVHA